MDPYENTSSRSGKQSSVCDPEIFTGMLQKFYNPKDLVIILLGLGRRLNILEREREVRPLIKREALNYNSLFIYLYIFINPNPSWTILHKSYLWDL